MALLPTGFQPEALNSTATVPLALTLLALALTDLLSSQTVAQIKATIYTLAGTLGLSTTTWQEGDPTRTLVAIVAQKLSDFTVAVQVAVAGGLLDYAEKGWLTLLARNVYNVNRITATFATGQVTLTNTGGGLYEIEAEDITFLNTAEEKTYRNVNGGTLAPFGTLTLDVRADEVGTDSNAAPGEIDDFVTNLLGVTVTNAAAVVGEDEESDTALRQRCRDALGALSPNGPAAAYEYVAKSTKRADGITTVAINRVKVSAESSTGTVTVTLAGPAGAPITADVDLVREAIIGTVGIGVLPLCVTPTVQAATALSIPITYEAFIPADSGLEDDEVEELVEAKLLAYFAGFVIGGLKTTEGGQGRMYHNHLRGRIGDAADDVFSVTLTAPAGDTDMTGTQVAVPGTITATITRVVQ